MNDTLVTIFRTVDIVKADLYEEMLRADAIAYVRRGPRPATLGAGAGAFEQSFDVAQTHRERAAQLALVLESDGVTDVPAPDGPPDSQPSGANVFRRWTPQLVRVGLFALAGLMLCAPTGLIAVLALRLGIRGLRMFDIGYIMSLPALAGVVIALLPSEYRFRALAFAVTVVVILAAFTATA